MAKKFDVYGIGNALVDMEFEVSTDFLKSASIEKGLMTLVDEPRQAEIINTLHGTQHKRSCGGSAANTMIAISQFGGRSFYSCKVASDETGDFYFKDLIMIIYNEKNIFYKIHDEYYIIIYCFNF